MKFVEVTLSLLAVLPAVVTAASVRRESDHDGRRGRGGFGGSGNGNFGGNNGHGGSVSSSAVASASFSTVATVSAVTNAAAATVTSSSNGGGSNSNDAQSSLTLDPGVLATGFEQNGQENATAGQVPSATSFNNFINFCLTVNKPITNGQQITGGSCNPAPMGQIASTANMPSAKFAFPTNNAVIPANQAFNVQMNVANLDTGFFVNADLNYFSAPQVCNSAGDIQGHSHVVIEQLDSSTQTTPTDPTKFAFFKGLDDAAVNGQLTAAVTAGLPAGSYRIASINTAANHQPVLVAIAQHGTLDDMVYFTVSDNAAGGSSGATVTSGAAATATSAAPSAASSAPAASKNTGSTNNSGKGNTQNAGDGNNGQDGNKGNANAKPNRRQLNRVVFV